MMSAGKQKLKCSIGYVKSDYRLSSHQPDSLTAQLYKTHCGQTQMHKNREDNIKSLSTSKYKQKNKIGPNLKG